MRFKKIINRPVVSEDDDVQVAGGISAAISVNTEEGSRTRTRISSRRKIVQRNGRTEVSEVSETRETSSEDTQQSPDPGPEKEDR